MGKSNFSKADRARFAQQAHDTSPQAVAQSIGMSVSTVHRWMRLHGLKPSRGNKPPSSPAKTDAAKPARPKLPRLRKRASRIAELDDSIFSPLSGWTLQHTNEMFKRSMEEPIWRHSDAAREIAQSAVGAVSDAIRSLGEYVSARDPAAEHAEAVWDDDENYDGWAAMWKNETRVNHHHYLRGVKEGEPVCEVSLDIELSEDSIFPAVSIYRTCILRYGSDRWEWEPDKDHSVYYD